MNTMMKWIIAVLVITAVVLGYKVYMAKKSPEVSTEEVQYNTTEDQGDRNATDLMLIQTTPTVSSTEEEKMAYFDLIRSKAVVATLVDVTSCVPKPLVISAKQGSEVTLRNDDAASHRLGFDQNTFFDVPGKSTRVIKVDLGKGPGIYGYGCDNSAKLMGVFLVTP
jgi:hypothetical protein